MDSRAPGEQQLLQADQDRVRRPFMPAIKELAIVGGSGLLWRSADHLDSISSRRQARSGSRLSGRHFRRLRFSPPTQPSPFERLPLTRPIACSTTWRNRNPSGVVSRGRPGHAGQLLRDVIAEASSGPTRSAREPGSRRQRRRLSWPTVRKRPDGCGRVARQMLVDRNGEKIGKLQDVYVDDETDHPQVATVKEFYRPTSGLRPAGKNPDLSR